MPSSRPPPTLSSNPNPRPKASPSTHPPHHSSKSRPILHILSSLGTLCLKLLCACCVIQGGGAHEMKRGDQRQWRGSHEGNRVVYKKKEDEWVKERLGTGYRVPGREDGGGKARGVHPSAVGRGVVVEGMRSRVPAERRRAGSGSAAGSGAKR